MMKLPSRLAIIAIGALVTGCSGSANQTSTIPKVTSFDPVAGSTLQFAVGTANIAGTVGLNTLATLRQNSGAAAGASVLSNAPSILGPSGFVVPSAADAYGDAGTASITGMLQTSLVTTPPTSTFDPAMGPASIVSSYGILPAAVNNSNTTPNLIPSALPYYVSANALLSAPLEYIGGPPAFTPPGHTSAQDGTFPGAPGAYPGYTLGFVDFQAAPVSGSYGLNVVIPTGIDSSGKSGFATKSATATLNAGTVLAAWSIAPTFAPDGAGGGTITLNFTGGAGITEEFVELVNTGGSAAPCQSVGKAPYYYTFQVAPGAATVVVPDTIGAAAPGKPQPRTLCAGDGYAVYGFAVDFPLVESAFPNSAGNVAPTIVGAGGQVDVTTSLASTGTST